MKCITLMGCLLSLTTTAHAQFGGYRYNTQGQLVDGRGQLANPHQELHDLLNPALWTTGAVSVSNTVDPNFTQATLAEIEAAGAPTTEPGGKAMSRLYLTLGNPYTPGTGIQSGNPLADNYTHYDQILIDAPVGGYVPTESGAYIAKTHPDSSPSLFNRGFNVYEANPKFLAAQAASGGLGGGVVFLVNQSAESFAHLRAISGSNVYMTAYVRPNTGGVVALGGQVVLNQQHNTTPALDTNQYGPAFAAGVNQIQQNTSATGNESGFWLTGTGNNAGIQFWGDGSANSISTAVDPNAQFHAHTHIENSGPSYMDMVNSAVLGGMLGIVASSNGIYAYGYSIEGGFLPSTDGSLAFFDAGMSNAALNGRPHVGNQSTSFGGGATYGSGATVDRGFVQSTDKDGKVVSYGTTTTIQTTAGFQPFGIGPTVGLGSQDGPLSPGTVPVGSLTVGTPFGTLSATVNLSNPADYSLNAGLPSLGMTVGIGTQTTSIRGGNNNYGAHDTSEDSGHSGNGNNAMGRDSWGDSSVDD